MHVVAPKLSLCYAQNGSLYLSRTKDFHSSRLMLSTYLLIPSSNQIMSYNLSQDVTTAPSNCDHSVAFCQPLISYYRLYTWFYTQVELREAGPISLLQMPAPLIINAVLISIQQHVPSSNFFKRNHWEPLRCLQPWEPTLFLPEWADWYQA